MPASPAPADPRVGVVIVTKDRADELATTLARLRADGGAARVVVVDNGSADDSVAVAHAAGPPVEVVALGENRGAAGRNVGAEMLDTPYVAFADDDSWWSRGALSRAADVFDSWPRLALVNGRILVGPEERLDPTCAVMARSPLRLAPPDGDVGDSGDLPGLLGFVACGAVVRREAFLGVGGFARWLGIGGEEELVALDLASAGWQLTYLDDVVAHHHPSTLRDSAGRRRRVARNTAWVAWSRLPAGTALRRTASLARRAAGDRATAAGLLDAVRAPTTPRDHRRRVPAEVVADLARLEAAQLTERRAGDA